MTIFNSVHTAYAATCIKILLQPEHISAPRGQKILERLDYSFGIDNPAAEAIRTNDEDRNKVIAAYFEKEKELYNSCTNKVMDFEKASKFWSKLQNPDGTVNSAYGHLLWYKKSQGNKQFGKEFMTPWEWAKVSLIQDKDSRQAVAHFSLPEHHWVGNKDQVCTLHATFTIRDNKLHLSVVMRSNDVVKGLAYDLPWFVSLMDRMLADLQPTYPELTKGTYRHLAHSMHIYERDIETVRRMLGQVSSQAA